MSRSGVLGDTNQFDPRAQGSKARGSVNLRGLRAQRTLVLINGRRMSPNPFGQAGAGIVDTNIIPTAAVGREVEVLKDGAAAAYGSDAIGGVVNYITRKNFNGMEVNASYTAPSTARTATMTAAILWGWSGDRGDVLLSAAYQHQSELAVTERDWANEPFTSAKAAGRRAAPRRPFLPLGQTATGAFTPLAGFQASARCAVLGRPR